MDKIAANNHFVTLRKEVKKAKAMVCGNLIRKINKLRKDKDKLEDETQMKKIDDKIANTLSEIKLIKILDCYVIAKKATLNPDVFHWDKVISDCKVTAEDRATARLVLKNNVQNQIQKFRSDHVDCDEWLKEYIEFREKKRDIKQTNTRKIKRKENKDQGKRVATSRGKKENIATKEENGRRMSGKVVSHETNNKSKGKFSPRNNDYNEDNLHPSWEVKRKQKELLKAALSGEVKPATRITFDA